MILLRMIVGKASSLRYRGLAECAGPDQAHFGNLYREIVLYSGVSDIQGLAPTLDCHLLNLGASLLAPLVG